MLQDKQEPLIRPEIEEEDEEIEEVRVLYPE